MEITLEAIISLVGLFVGGGGGAFFMWKWQRRKAKAEAREAETAATKELQDLYQQMLADAKADREDRLAQNEELRAERDHYKADRNELRDEVEKLQQNIFEWRKNGEEERIALKRQIANLEARVDRMVPFMCGDLSCQLRKRVQLSDVEATEKQKQKPKKMEKPTS